MVQKIYQTFTLAEFLQLPETKPAREYLNGHMRQKPMPQGKHSVIQGELVTAINQIVKPPQIARAFPELRCTFGDRSIVPDIAVFLWNRIPRDVQGAVANTFPIAPDWAIEILSPDQNSTRVTQNLLHCLRYGTQMGWLIDPAEQMLLIYRPQQEPMVLDLPNEMIPVPHFASALQLTVNGLFAWLWE